MAVPCDVTDPESVRETIAKAVAGYGTVDILINNAGTIEVGPQETMDAVDYDRAASDASVGPDPFRRSRAAVHAPTVAGGL